MTTNKGDYIPLSVLIISYVSAIFYYKSSQMIVLFSTVVFSTLYIIWGIYHEYKAHKLHGKIVLEYFLVALLGVAIVATLLV